MKINAALLSKTGAIFYILWGVLHIVVGAIPLLRLYTDDWSGFFDFHRFELAPDALDASMIHAGHMIAEHSAELIAFGLLSIIVAIALNWKNDPLGFWINFIVLGIVDLAFLTGEIIPGYIPFEEGIIGPVLYLIAAILTAIALIYKAPTSEQIDL